MKQQIKIIFKVNQQTSAQDSTASSWIISGTF